MRVKNLTPFAFGPKLTARKPPQKELSLAVRGAFHLRPDEPLSPFEDYSEPEPMQAEAFLPDDDDRRGESLYPGDFADFKLRGEVFLQGTCHAPAGKPVAECSVRFAVGAWSKTLQVIGQRFWSDGVLQTATEPAPFTSMPLRYANAYGGPGYAKNPVGKGYDTLELPTVEAKGALLRSRGDRPEPAGFGPISSGWAQRAGKMGRAYGGAYRQERAPFYAEDFDWSYFNAAPFDQQLEGYLRGDEEMSFQNLHPGTPTFAVRLPGLRVRAFVKDDEARFREVRLLLDTLFADTDRGLLFLTWRGLTPVKEARFRDVETLLIASEPLADAPLPEAHYREVLAAFEKDPIGMEQALQALDPAHQVAARAALGGEPLPKDEPPAGASPAQELAHLAKRGFGLSDEEAAKVQRSLEDALAQAPTDTDPRTQIAEMLGRTTLDPTASARLVANMATQPPQSLGDAMKQVADGVAKLKQISAERGLRLAGLDQIEASLAELPPAALTALDPSSLPPDAPEPGPGVDCSGRDLRGQDLSGRDLRGADLTGTLLDGANLRGANLSGARLSRTLLEGADLTDANLDGAVLVEVLLTDAVARGASFQGATLERCILEKIDLRGANLERASVILVLGDGADLRGVRAKGAKLHKLSVEKGNLDGADFTDAELTECALLECGCRGLVMESAALQRSTFAGSDLSDASFVRARGAHTIWRGARLDRTDFSVAVLPSAFFDDATGTETRFYGANLKEGRFTGASLERAEMVKANLFGADLGGAALSGTRFTGANLYDANLLGASGSGTDFTGANLTRARMEPA